MGQRTLQSQSKSGFDTNRRKAVQRNQQLDMAGRLVYKGLVDVVASAGMLIRRSLRTRRGTSTARRMRHEPTFVGCPGGRSPGGKAVTYRRGREGP